jgi:site-specific DNA-methyltransferase (adenine-specific)
VKEFKSGKITLINGDCMDYLAECGENEFDLAVVDPPYNIERFNSAPSRISKYGQMKTVNSMPPDSFFVGHLKSVSKNQIVWGYNHLADLLGPTKEFIFWYKHNPVASYSDGELAWTSFTKTAKVFDYQYFGAINKDVNRIHPTQKPVALYKWIYTNYAKPGQRVIDTHLGSGSSAIAAHYYGLEFVGIELDTDYFNAAVERFKRETRQIDMLGY